MLIIIDYGMGNLGSLTNMLKKIRISAKITSSIDDIHHADKLILPGVGSFNHGIQKLQELQLINILNKKVIEDCTPILGICLGMQLFTKASEEGTLPGLGWLNAYTIKFKFEDSSILKIPHMGWDNLTIIKSHPLYHNIESDSMFYFTHSYHVVCHDEQDILSISKYGYNFVSSISRDNIVGVQFHPEKSHKYGMKILENFVNSNTTIK
jgi:glutamine amidotransferase